MKVVSYEHLFGDNDFISCEEEHVMIKDGIKYLPLDVIKSIGFQYLSRWVQEVEFERTY